MQTSKVEKDPTGLSAHTPGAKLDAGKVRVTRGAIKYFPRALRGVAAISEFGAHKYAWNGWEAVEDGPQRYDDALGRHQTDEAIDGLYAPDSGYLHAAHVAWNSLARLDLMLRSGIPLRDPAFQNSEDELMNVKETLENFKKEFGVGEDYNG